jgi:WD40 repeat protein
VVKVWDAATGEMLKQLPPVSPMSMTAAWSRDGKSLVVALGDPIFRVKTGSVQVFDTETWLPRKDADWSAHAALSAVFSPDGKRLAVAGPLSVAVYDFRTGKRLVECKGANGVRVVAWSPDGNWLATGGGKGVAQLWDARTGGEEATLSGHAEQVLGLAFGPTGRLGTASTDGTVKSWAR